MGLDEFGIDFCGTIEDRRPRKTTVDLPIDKHIFTSGATSSENKPAYHLIPMSAVRKMALRFTLGKQKHGDVNYQKCVVREGNKLKLDVQFARDRYDHAVEHLLKLKAEGDISDDNIGAVLWFCALVTWLEDQGFNWRRILTPEQVNEKWLILNTDTHEVTVE